MFADENASRRRRRLVAAYLVGTKCNPRPGEGRRRTNSVDTFDDALFLPLPAPLLIDSLLTNSMYFWIRLSAGRETFPNQLGIVISFTLIPYDIAKASVASIYA